MCNRHVCNYTSSQMTMRAFQNNFTNVLKYCLKVVHEPCERSHHPWPMKLQARFQCEESRLIVTIVRCNMLYNGVNYRSPVRDGDLEVKIIIAGSNLWNTRLGCRQTWEKCYFLVLYSRKTVKDVKLIFS